MDALFIPFLLLVGGLLAVQAAANLQLAASVGSPVGGAALQLGIGAGLLVALAAVLGTLGTWRAVDDVAAWHLVGGLASALYITAGILLFPRLGAVVTVGLFVAGQMLASIALDGLGWLGVAQEPIDAPAVLGVAGVVVGTLLVVQAQSGGALDAAVRGRRRWISLALAAGAVLPIQGAVNAQLRSDLDAPVAAAAWSFIVAAATMLVVLAAFAALRPAARRPHAPDVGAIPWWGWLGGLCGAVYVTSVFLLLPRIGVAPTLALTVGGQQIASVFIDRYGLLRLPRREVTRRRLLGALVLLAGVALIQVA